MFAHLARQQSMNAVLPQLAGLFKRIEEAAKAGKFRCDLTMEESRRSDVYECLTSLGYAIDGGIDPSVRW